MNEEAGAAGASPLESGDAPILWRPSPERAKASEMARFVRWLEAERGLVFDGYPELWEWSTTDLPGFWTAVRDFWDLRFPIHEHRVLDRPVMPGARWFEGARLNYADQVWRHLDEGDPDRPAILWRTETGEGVVSWAQLASRTANLGAALRRLGVGPGDRVVAVLPNGPESVIAFLAAASVGATWSLCSPEMGLRAILDRFRQIEPKVLIAADGYVFRGQPQDRRGAAEEIAHSLPGLVARINVPVLPGPPHPAHGALDWRELVEGPLKRPQTERVAFDHPLWIVYSSGTTGSPKPIVHGHGGVLLEAMKLHLHMDVKDTDVFMWLTSPSWIMWNVQAAALLRGATVAMFDGAPDAPDMGEAWRFAGRSGVSFLGAGAAYVSACIKAGVRPREAADLSALRTISATGSPLAPESYTWLSEAVAEDAWIAPISGGTDFAGAFVGGHPMLPVRAGEMQCRWLGARVEAWDEAGRPVHDAVGELVCTKPMPSMPLFLWGDEDGSRLHDSYFDTYPGVWRHGDWIRIAPSGGAVIYGRSDATLNRRGLRLGSSEIYRAVEELPEVLDSLVVDLEFLGRDPFMPLFIVPRPGAALDDALRGRIRDAIRAAVSARFLPDEIVEVPEIPRTLSGKKLEVPVKKLLLGTAPAKAVNRDSMANPRSFDAFVAYARARSGG